MQLSITLASITFILFHSAEGLTEANSDDSGIIETTHGPVQGVHTTVSARRVDIYWGIPYAKRPRRFKRAERGDPWEGVLKADSPPPSCPEVPYRGLIPLIPPVTTPFSEDCLYLNVWVPRDCPQTTANHRGLAMMVWLHGGALEWGSTTVPTYNGDMLAATQCVLVASVNYRLGPFGFLSVDSQHAPGNLGLLDQAMALEWLRENVENFGGSADLITLFGESSGALSVGALMASPLSRHLFSRAILQSGPPVAGFAQRTVEQNTHNARKLAEFLNCPIHNNDAMITCLSNLNTEEISRAMLNLPYIGFPAFGIVVDDYFLREPLPDYFFRGDLNSFSVMIGLTKNDSSFALFNLNQEPGNIESRPTFNRSAFYRLLKQSVIPTCLTQQGNKDIAARMIEFLYFNSTLPNMRGDYWSALEKVMKDVCFLCPAYSTVSGLLDKGNAFFYSFNYRPSVTPVPEWMGVVHASELDLVFGRPLDSGAVHTEQDKLLSRTMMKAWANFAKFGDPNGPSSSPSSLPAEWPPLNSRTYPYAVFSSPDMVTIKQGLGYRECVFWNHLYGTLADTLPKSDEYKKGHDEL